MPNSSVIAVFTCLPPLSLQFATCCWSVDNLEQSCGTHAAADAHGYNSILGLTPAALDQGMAGQTRARHAIGMANRNRAAVDVELFRVDAELVAAIDDLH